MSRAENLLYAPHVCNLSSFETDIGLSILAASHFAVSYITAQRPTSSYKSYMVNSEARTQFSRPGSAAKVNRRRLLKAGVAVAPAALALPIRRLQELRCALQKIRFLSASLPVIPSLTASSCGPGLHRIL
jgi:hypothetical protein